jgi:hypothetical protein
MGTAREWLSALVWGGLWGAFMAWWTHAETDARKNCSSQSLAVANRNETGLLMTYLDDSHRTSQCSSTATPAFAPHSGIAHTTRIATSLMIH